MHIFILSQKFKIFKLKNIYDAFRMILDFKFDQIKENYANKALTRNRILINCQFLKNFKLQLCNKKKIGQSC